MDVYKLEFLMQKFGLLGVSALMAIALFAFSVPTAHSQSDGWAKFGASLARGSERPAIPIQSVSLTGQEGSRIYASCLQGNTVKYSGLGAAPNEAVQAAFGTCKSERSQFYSAVFSDYRANNRESAAIIYANTILGRFEEDSWAALPGIAIKAQSTTSSIASSAVPLGDKYDKLGKLKSLLDSGAISEDEFKVEKQKLLSE